MIDTKIRAWLDKMEERVKQSSQKYSTPDVVTGYYAVGNVMGTYRISNGRTWWDNPVLVREIHEYNDGTVCATYYVEGVQTFNRQEIEESGLLAISPAGLGQLFSVSKLSYTDHRRRDNRGRAVRVVYDLLEVEE